MSTGKQPSTQFRVRVEIVAAIITATATLIAAIIGVIYVRNNYPKPTPSPVVISSPTLNPTPTPPPPPMLVQKNISPPGASTPNTVTFHDPVKAGDLIVVAITQFETTIKGKPTDSVGNTYTPVQTGPVLFADRANQFDYIELYYAKNVTGGNITVTVNFTQPADPNSGDSNVGIYEFSGLSETSPLGAVTLQYGLGNKPSGGSLTTTEDNEVIFVVGVDRGLDNPRDPNVNTPVSPGKEYRPLHQQDDSENYERFYTEYQIMSPGTYLTDFLLKYSTNWAVIGAAFKP